MVGTSFELLNDELESIKPVEHFATAQTCGIVIYDVLHSFVGLAWTLAMSCTVMDCRCSGASVINWAVVRRLDGHVFRSKLIVHIGS